MTGGKIVLAYNLEGVAGLRLSRAAYAGIFLGAMRAGTIRPRDEPGVARGMINGLCRRTAAGHRTCSQHLSAISAEFAAGPGTSKSPNWPVGTRAKGNEGVTASLMTTPGSIGYVEYGYASGQKLPMALLENRSGAYVAPTPASGQAALTSAALPDNLVGWIPDPEGADSYPSSRTWLIGYRNYNDAARTRSSANWWCLEAGQSDSEGWVSPLHRVSSRGPLRDH